MVYGRLTRLSLNLIPPDHQEITTNLMEKTLYFSITISTALMCTGIPPSRDNFKKAIEYRILQTAFYSGFESVAIIAF